jgi:hypothetical protein
MISLEKLFSVEKIIKINATLDVNSGKFNNVWAYNPVDVAMNHLRGRTNYYDEQTRKYFSSRVLECFLKFDDLICVTRESYLNYDKNRLTRYVCFDVFGNVVFRGSIGDNEDGFKTVKQAEKAYEEWVKSFTVCQYYTDLLLKMVDKQNQLSAELSALAGAV